MVFMAIFSEFIANDEPIIGRDEKGEWVSWMWDTGHKKSSELEWGIYPPIRFDSDQIDLSSANYSPPGTISEDDNRHWLGTDLIGRDVAAGMVYGCRLSFLTALLAVFIALIIGLPLGTLSGFFGNRKIRLDGWSWVLIGLMTGILLYVIFYWTYLHISIKFASVILAIASAMVIRYRDHRLSSRSAYPLPLDTLFTRLVELMVSLPGLIILLAVSAAFDSKSAAATALVLGLLRWVRIGQVSRNETIRLIDESFVQSARALGFSNWRIIRHHIIPNLAGPLLVIVVFSVAGFILLESALSFLGIGVALEHQTWGSMLSESRNYIKAWWLALFPGLAIFLSIVSLNAIGEDLRQR